MSEVIDFQKYKNDKKNEDRDLTFEERLKRLKDSLQEVRNLMEKMKQNIDKNRKEP